MHSISPQNKPMIVLYPKYPAHTYAIAKVSKGHQPAPNGSKSSITKTFIKADKLRTKIQKVAALTDLHACSKLNQTTRPLGKFRM